MRPRDKPRAFQQWRRYGAMMMSVAVLAGCARPAATAPAKVPAAEVDPAGAPSRHRLGDSFAAVIPLQSGEQLPVERLRGKSVVLEISTAAQRDLTIEQDYADLLRRHEDLAVVIVLVDARGWDTLAPEFTLGWDPDGALAAYLQAASLPLVLVLDGQGRVVEQYAGGRSGHPRVVVVLRKLLDPSEDR